MRLLCKNHIISVSLQTINISRSHALEYSDVCCSKIVGFKFISILP